MGEASLSLNLVICNHKKAARRRLSQRFKSKTYIDTSVISTDAIRLPSSAPFWKDAI